MTQTREFIFRQIGTLYTPYEEKAPYQPVELKGKEFFAELDEKYTQGLQDIEKFNYIYLLFLADRITRRPEMLISPPWADGKQVGLFSSRSPVRPNPIGLSIVKVLEIRKNRIYTSGLDVFNRTPLLDIKPYIKDLDDKNDANHGWIEDLEDREHLSLHVKGIPHDY